jgi:hypothetical protein
MSSTTVQDLFTSAEQDGALSQEAVNVLLQVDDIGASIQDGLGVSVDDVSVSDAVLLGIEPDDSGSIRMAGNSQIMRDGVNLVVNAVNGAKQKNNVFAHIRLLNGQVICPFVLIDQVPKLDAHNFNPTGGTPFYEQGIVFLGTIAAKMQEFALAGTPSRAVILLPTDGAPTDTNYTAEDLRKVVVSLLKTEQYIIAGLGIDDGSTDFVQTFKEIGIPEEWILTTKNTEKEIRAAFQLFSQTAVRASQSGKSFSETALGGFGG